jgi:hypothetical protein
VQLHTTPQRCEVYVSTTLELCIFIGLLPISTYATIFRLIMNKNSLYLGENSEAPIYLENCHRNPLLYNILSVLLYITY